MWRKLAIKYFFVKIIHCYTFRLCCQTCFIFQVKHAELNKDVSLKNEFKTVLKFCLPDFTMDVESEEAIDRIYYEFLRKLSNTRIQEYISSTKQEFAAKKGLVSTVKSNLHAKLLTQHTNL